MPEQHEIQLGSTVKDTISGFKGVAIGRCVWLYGCVRVIVQSQELKDSKPVEPQWFDEAQVQVIAPPSKAIQKTLEKETTPAGPRNDPTLARCPSPR